ncbi:hypothetical protein [Neptunomonas sp.]|uniref:hypothetical protein n=1 Tax=Neptunomonas sp. TaxID=1971898 RepID=UPI0025EB9DB0|nr:hypothetical protein [Neptunomonas sp.]
MTITVRAILLSVMISFLMGCQQGKVRSFSVKNLAKSDIDMVTDAHLQELNKLARQLLIKLYKLNPRELSKAPPGMTVDKRIHQLFSMPRIVQFAELGEPYGTTAVPVAFNPNFSGDRVFALMAGVAGMIHGSYNYQDEFFMLDEIDQQKLYHCARNLESIAWQLHHRHDKRGELLLISNSMNNATRETNLSTERLLAKMISLQDMMARILSDKNNRTINKVLHGVASTTLLPI